MGNRRLVQKDICTINPSNNAARERNVYILLASAMFGDPVDGDEVGLAIMLINLANTIDPHAGGEATTADEPACYRTLRAKIAKKNAMVAVCGMGYVGLPLSRAIWEQGFPVVGLDIDDDKVEKLNAGQSYIRHIPPATIQAMLKGGRFRASSDFSDIAAADVITVCVPTPLNRYREPDLSYVVSTAEVIARH